jgi:hypothetical protein
LFAPDAEFIGVPERVLRGREEIQGFYDAVRQVDALPLSLIDRGDECVMELAAKNPGSGEYRLVAVDHFTLNSQRQIKRLVVFFRPTIIQAAQQPSH